MTYKELSEKAYRAFDPDKRGFVQGRPVMVLFTISRLADTDGWDKPVNTEVLKQRLTTGKLDSQSVSTVLSML